jgi:leader peptidase (prepilin peptidase) / N-methyltransferase
MLTLVSIFFGLEIFIIGLFIGSFLNVLADRLPNDKSILGRSHCEFCHHVLNWRDLIPVISFVYLRGKCRYCHKKFSVQYPLLEILTGILFSATYFFSISNAALNPNSFIINLIIYLILVSCLIVIFFSDFRYGLIPDEVIAFGSLTAFIWLVLFNSPQLVNHIISAFGACLFFLIIFIVTKARGIGFGDVKLGFFLGLFLGFPQVALALYIAFLTGGLTGLILILWKKKRMNSAVAFGPFLILGTFLSFFFSPILIPKIVALLS